MLLKAVKAFCKGRARVTPKQADEYFKRAEVESFVTKVGDFPADPPIPANTPDGKLRFTIKEGDMLVRNGDPARHLALLQLRSVGGA